MTAATEDPLAAQARTVRARTVQTQTVQTQTVQTQTAQTQTAQAHLVQAGVSGRAPCGLTGSSYRRHREEIWDALTRPGWTQLYGYRAPAQYEMRPGGAYRAFASVTMKMQGISGVIFDGEVIEAEPPWRLVQTWHVLLRRRYLRAESDTRLQLGDSRR